MTRKHDIFEVADWFLSKESISPKRLTKLVYYAQAWSYTLFDKPLMFNTDGSAVEFEAWAHGPANKALLQKYQAYRWNGIPLTPDNSNVFSRPEIELLESVFETYGSYSPIEIENLTREEEPWQKARRRAGVSAGERANEVISPVEMRDYYSRIYVGDDFGEAVYN
jgi:uncharacterized phage-associated protein